MNLFEQARQCGSDAVLAVCLKRFILNIQSESFIEKQALNVVLLCNLVDQRTPGPVCRTGPAARSGFGPETGPFTAGPDRDHATS